MGNEIDHKKVVGEYVTLYESLKNISCPRTTIFQDGLEIYDEDEKSLLFLSFLYLYLFVYIFSRARHGVEDVVLK